MFVTFNANNNLFGSVTNVGTKDTTPQTKLGGIARSPFDKDSVSISPQAKSNNALQQLTERKEDIRQEKMEYQMEALANGEDPEIMEANLELYDARIEDIDNQINDLFKPELENVQTQQISGSNQGDAELRMIELTTAGTNSDNAKNAYLSHASKNAPSIEDSSSFSNINDLKMNAENMLLLSSDELLNSSDSSESTSNTQLSLYDMEATKFAYQLTQNNITA